MPPKSSDVGNSDMEKKKGVSASFQWKGMDI